LNVISNWAKKWAVQFNPQKTKNIVFSRRDREHPPVYFGLNGDELEKLHRRPVIIRPASICTLSNKSDSFLVQLPHTTSPYSKTGLINAKYIRIREYLSNKCLTCLSKNKREHAFL
jgi:hypothetical protein